MAEADDLTIRIVPDQTDVNALELAGLGNRLRRELLTLDVASVEAAESGTPEGSKGIGAVLGWLVVKLGREQLRVVIAAIADWAVRNDRPVEIILDGDLLRLGRATRQQQQQAFEAWLARHTSSAPAEDMGAPESQCET